MLFSIVVPIYNVEKYIRKCVDSLRNQTYEDIEIILVDDQSPDNCPFICDEYEKIDSRIKVIHKINGGLSDARNSGLQIARGKYVLFVDSDDYIELNTCEKLVSFAQDDTDILVCDAHTEGGKDLIHNNLQGNEVSGSAFLKEALLQNEMPMAAWLNVYRRDFLLEHGLIFKKGILHEDEQFTPRAFLKAKKVVYTGIWYYHYIIRENSITTKKDKRRNMNDFFGTCKELEEIYNELHDIELRELLLNSLVDKYLSLFYAGNLVQYGKQFVYKEFVKNNSRLKKTKIKGILFRFSPRIYIIVNKVSKKIGR